jgi:hypothetical protein
MREPFVYGRGRWFPRSGPVETVGRETAWCSTSDMGVGRGKRA